MSLEDFKVTVGAWGDAWLAAVERCQSTRELKELEVAFRKEMRELMGQLWQK